MRLVTNFILWIYGAMREAIRFANRRSEGREGLSDAPSRSGLNIFIRGHFDPTFKEHSQK